MRAGWLRHRVQIYKNTPTRDDYGTSAPGWGPIVESYRWARVTPLAGREAERAKQVNSETTHEVEIRYSDDITTEMRVKYNDRYLEIIGIVNKDERNISLVLSCKEAA